MARYRSERWQLSYGMESAYGAAPTGATTAPYILGAFDDATLPDPEFDHVPFWFFKTAAPANRDFFTAYRGRARYSGSIPDIVLLDGQSLSLPIGNLVVHAGANPYTHTINPENALFGTDLFSFRTIASYFDGEGGNLVRFWNGGKVNRATITCAEGGFLTMSLDEVLFRQVYYDAVQILGSLDTLITPYYDADVAAQSLTYPSREPYYFSECEVRMKVAHYVNATTSTLTEVIVPSVSQFRLDINNNLIPKYYLSDLGTDDAHGPYQIVEGRQEIRLGMTIELQDYAANFGLNDLFMNLLRQGRETATSAYTNVKGVAIRITFTRAGDSSDYIQFSIPSDYVPDVGGEQQGALIVRAPHNIITEGLVSIPVEMICRNVGVVISDRINGTTYPDQNTN